MAAPTEDNSDGGEIKLDHNSSPIVKTSHASLVSMEKFMDASDKAAQFLASQVGPDGRLKNKRLAGDLLPVCKLPTLLMLSGHTSEAHRLLTRIKRDFMQLNGDLLSYPDKTGADRKSSSFPMCHYWSYMNAWVAMAAQRLGRFDISIPLFNYCKTYYNPELKAVCVSEPYAELSETSTMDCLSSAHFGLLCLYMGDVTTARNIGEGLIRFMEAQPNLDKVFLCRMSAQTGSLITVAPENMEPFYFVKKDKPNQFFFFLGYHGIFMIKLYQATCDARFLESAKAVLDFAMGCHEGICTTTFSHKVMCAAALVAKETKEAKYRRFAIGLGEFMLMTRTEEGLFCKDLDLIDRYDQTSEISFCLREVCSALDSLMSQS